MHVEADIIRRKLNSSLSPLLPGLHNYPGLDCRRTFWPMGHPEGSDVLTWRSLCLPSLSDHSGTSRPKTPGLMFVPVQPWVCFLTLKKKNTASFQCCPSASWLTHRWYQFEILHRLVLRFTFTWWKYNLGFKLIRSVVVPPAASIWSSWIICFQSYHIHKLRLHATHPSSCPAGWLLYPISLLQLGGKSTYCVPPASLLSCCHWTTAFALSSTWP